MPRRFQAVRRRFLKKRMQDEPESVAVGRFCLRLNELLERYGLSDEEYLNKILPGINESNIFNQEVAERAIRKYRERKSHGG